MKPEIKHIETIGEYYRWVGAKGSKHPLLGLFAYQDLPDFQVDKKLTFTFGFYTISIKIDYHCKARYGQTRYDFDEGLMSFTAPSQLGVIDEDFVAPKDGWLLLVHPDFMHGYPLARKLRDYAFFNYSVNEGLILSEEEEASVMDLFSHIQKEYLLPIDHSSQDVLIAQIDLLLTLCQRYYNRQFITRKKPNSDLLSKFESLLHEHFYSQPAAENGPPSVAHLAGQLNVSPNYLSDVLRSLTGQNAQQHIHNKLIEKAKELLSASRLSVSEIAYQLGFDYPQSFSTLFKNKTGITPLKFRAKYN